MNDNRRFTVRRVVCAIVGGAMMIAGAYVLYVAINLFMAAEGQGLAKLVGLTAGAMLVFVGLVLIGEVSGFIARRTGNL